jgi:putative PIN family toxin of toxin-antitoxin system
LNGEINLIVSQPIIDEMTDVPARKFDATPEELAEARENVTQAARTVKPAVELDVIKDDPSDNRILECAVSARSDYIVTGDSHLLKLKQYARLRTVAGHTPPSWYQWDRLNPPILAMFFAAPDIFSRLSRFVEQIGCVANVRLPPLVFTCAKALLVMEDDMAFREKNDGASLTDNGFQDCRGCGNLQFQ